MTVWAGRIDRGELFPASGYVSSVKQALLNKFSSAEHSSHACNQYHGPPCVMSSVSGSSTHESPCSESHAPCQIICHSGEQRPHYHHVHPGTSEGLRRLQGSQTLGCLWGCADTSWSASSESLASDVSACCGNPRDKRWGSTHGSIGDRSVVHLDMLLMKEREYRLIAEQRTRAAELASAANKAALEEAKKENAALQRACKYGKVPMSQHVL